MVSQGAYKYMGHLLALNSCTNPDPQSASRAQNSGLSQVIFRPTLAYDRAKSNLVGQIYCTFPMGKPMIVYNNVTILNKWPTNFQPLF